MPWYQVLSIILGSIGTLLGIFGFSAYWNERMKHKAQKKNEKEDEAEKKKLEDQKRLEEMRKQEEQEEFIKLLEARLVTPILSRLDVIEDDLGKVKKGVQVTCRNDLEDLYNEAKKEKFCSDDDKQRFEATYQAYHSLGKNGIMDNKQKIILAMPETKPVTKRKSRAKKQILVEGN